MKLIHLTLLTTLCLNAVAEAQPNKKAISLQVNAAQLSSSNFIQIKNINGEVKIIGYAGDKVYIEANREIWKQSENSAVSDLEAGSYQIKTKWHEGNLYVFVEGPGLHPEFYDGKFEYHVHWDDDHEYDFSFDFNIKVPNRVLVKASTVNNGELIMANLPNGVQAAHVNGGIKLNEVAGEISARNVNGDIEVTLSKSPVANADFETVNGTIVVFSPEKLNAVVTFESLHGELYTNFDEVSFLPNSITTQNEGKRYKISTQVPIQIGDGGATMNFTMVNGNAYLKKRES